MCEGVLMNHTCDLYRGLTLESSLCLLCAWVLKLHSVTAEI